MPRILAALLAGFGLALIPLAPMASAADEPAARVTRIVLAREAGRTVLTLYPDEHGQNRDGVLLLPIPGEIEASSGESVDGAAIDRLDVATMPRPVAEGTCTPPPESAPALAPDVSGDGRGPDSYYDIKIFSPADTGMIERSLVERHVVLSPASRTTLAGYQKQRMNFVLVGRVANRLPVRPSSPPPALRIVYKSKNFMLPIRLNGNDRPQEWLIFALTRHGRVEAANYLTVKIQGDLELSPLTLHDFAKFHQSLFDRASHHGRSRAIVLEFAGSLSDCPHYFSQPLTAGTLGYLSAAGQPSGNGAEPDIFVTRLHIRYERRYFPEDLLFNETRDRAPFVARYPVRQPLGDRAGCRGERPARSADALEDTPLYYELLFGGR